MTGDTSNRTDPRANASLALLTGQVDISTPELDTTPYTKEYKLFICPSSSDKPSSENASLPIGILTSPATGSAVSSGAQPTCSYAYAYGLNLQTHPDTAVMADRKIIAGFTTVGWNGSAFNALRPQAAHGNKGVNVLYVGGNARWIASNEFPGGDYGYVPKDPFPNCGNNKSNPMYNLHITY